MFSSFVNSLIPRFNTDGLARAGEFTYIVTVVICCAMIFILCSSIFDCINSPKEANVYKALQTYAEELDRQLQKEEDLKRLQSVENKLLQQLFIHKKTNKLYRIIKIDSNTKTAYGYRIDKFHGKLKCLSVNKLVPISSIQEH